jgi:hypothetical protein
MLKGAHIAFECLRLLEAEFEKDGGRTPEMYSPGTGERDLEIGGYASAIDHAKKAALHLEWVYGAGEKNDLVAFAAVIFPVGRKSPIYVDFQLPVAELGLELDQFARRYLLPVAVSLASAARETAPAAPAEANEKPAAAAMGAQRRSCRHRPKRRRRPR